MGTLVVLSKLSVRLRSGGLVVALICSQIEAHRAFALESQPLVPGGRIDAICNLGQGVVIAGSRNPNPGHVFRSVDFGRAWCRIGKQIRSNGVPEKITCIAAARGGVAYLLTGKASVWKTNDWGTTWKLCISMPSSPAFGPYEHSYGITVLRTGTILVGNTNPAGGHIFRSINLGRTWQDLGPQSSSALYRFEKLPNAVLMNGWQGSVYRSADDGKTWQSPKQLCNSAIYATEYLDDGVVLQGSEDGRIFRSADFGITWDTVAHFPESADDFVYLGGGRVLFATYSGGRNTYESADFGLTWKRRESMFTGSDQDYLDHLVSVECCGRIFAVCGTFRGNIVRFR